MKFWRLQQFLNKGHLDSDFIRITTFDDMVQVDKLRITGHITKWVDFPILPKQFNAINKINTVKIKITLTIKKWKIGSLVIFSHILRGLSSNT